MEADDLEIAGMHLHDHAGLLGDSVLIITETGFIGSADFDQLDACLLYTSSTSTTSLPLLMPTVFFATISP